MDLKVEYQQDVVIEGMAYVLNNVLNTLVPEGTQIRRIYIGADGKSKKFFDQLIRHPHKAPAAPVAPAAAPATKTKAEDEPDDDDDPDEKKPGFFGRAFGNKGKKKGHS